jgi:hypothetical protein
MEAIIGLIEWVGGIILFIEVGLLLARVSGYGEYYDKMLYDEDSDEYITIKKNKKDNDEDMIHHVSI